MSLGINERRETRYCWRCCQALIPCEPQADIRAGGLVCNTDSIRSCSGALRYDWVGRKNDGERRSLLIIAMHTYCAIVGFND